MRVKKVLITVGYFVIHILSQDSVEALEIKSHREVTEKATVSSVVDNYLKTNLELAGGIEQTLNGKKILNWLKNGSEYEDNAPRWRNHYFNPLKSWNDAGLNDIWWGKASILWVNDTGNEWSWQKAREYYYQALISVDKNNREINFANTFRTIGQVMHLVQDISVPAHTRNDAHILRNYEDWVDINLEKININPQFSTISLNTITQLWDTNQYNGSNPSASFTLGLAEYSNANFLSEDTIFTEDLPFGHKHYQPYPRRDSVIDPVSGKQPPEEITAEDGKADRVFYVKKVKDGEIVNHLAQASYLASDLYVKLWPFEIGLYYRLSFQLDDTVYKDYASLLLPRAVGYSAGLLNHFFRGQMEANGEVAKDSSGNITGITIKVKNLTSNEDMRDGNFVVSYKYKPTGSNEYVYGLSDKQYFGTIPYNNDPENYKYTFNFPAQNPIPKDAADIQYILVFQGTLGNEKDNAVIGRVVTLACGGDIWEDWECGLTGKHPWNTTPPYWKVLNFTVVDGFGDNTSKVLQVSGSPFTYFGYITVNLQEPLPIPKKMSFDYYAKSLGATIWDFDWIVLQLWGSIGSAQLYVMNPNMRPYWATPGCHRITYPNYIWNGCIFDVNIGKWETVDMDILGLDIGEIDMISFFAYGGGVEGIEVYIDNIDFKY